MRKDRDAEGIPELFVERMREDIGEDAVARLCEALDGDSPVSVRFNPYKLTSAPQTLEPIGWSRYGFYLDKRPLFTLDAAFHAGVYYVQEASSQFVGHILSNIDISGSRVLDMCAAPGGKSTLYSTLVGVEGLVVANEINKQRAAILVDNAKRWGLGNIVVTNNDSSRVAQFEQWWDIVAVDAPCSGEGMFRKNRDSRGEWSLANVAMCAKRQREILDNAWRALKPGGTLIYSTCTFNREENEELLSWFMDSYGEEVVPFESVECREEWGVESSQVGDFQCFRFYPHMSRGEGFFVAVACKRFDVGGRCVVPKSRKSILSDIDKVSLREVSRWVEQSGLMEFRAVNDTIYAYFTTQAEAVRQLAESLTVIYSGVAMGQIFKGRLKPDAALALFCGVNREVVDSARLAGEDMLRYLRREELPAELFPAEGINLVCTDKGYTVGWAKRIGARVNNIYPMNMRILKRDFQ